MNAIITNEFDFGNEEVLAYYISFLKNLSLVLNKDTVHFFHNEHVTDFPLFSKAVAMFNHKESMVRVAVRTIVLNVLKVAVGDASVRRFLGGTKTREYFATLALVIGNLSAEMDKCLRTEADHMSWGRLEFFVHEHLDHFHFLNDALMLQADDINQMLIDQLIRTLLVPLYVYGLSRQLPSEDIRLRIDPLLSFYLLSHIFLVFDDPVLVNMIGSTVLFGTLPLDGDDRGAIVETSDESVSDGAESTTPSNEKGAALGSAFIVAVFDAMTADHSDLHALQALVLVYSMFNNRGLDKDVLNSVRFVEPSLSTALEDYNHELVAALLKLLGQCAVLDSRTRPVTLSLAIKIIRDLVLCPPSEIDHEGNSGASNTMKLTSRRCILSAVHMDQIRMAYGVAKAEVASLYCERRDQGRNEVEKFLQEFEVEFRKQERGLYRVKVPLLMSQASVLLAPTNSNIDGLDIEWRLPSDSTERGIRAIQTFLQLRKFVNELENIEESELPIRRPHNSLSLKDSLSLNGSDLIACNVLSKNRHGQMLQVRRFLMVDKWRLVLLEPDNHNLGSGIVRFVASLCNVSVKLQPSNTKALDVTIYKTPASHGEQLPQFTGRFVFDDHIRAVAARQYLDEGRATLIAEKVLVFGSIIGDGGNNGDLGDRPSGNTEETVGEITPDDASDDGNSALNVEETHVVLENSAEPVKGGNVVDYEKDIIDQVDSLSTLVAEGSNLNDIAGEDETF